MPSDQQEDLQVTLVEADLKILDWALRIYFNYCVKSQEQAESMGFTGGVQGLENDREKIKGLARQLGINLQEV